MHSPLVHLDICLESLQLLMMYPFMLVVIHPQLHVTEARLQFTNRLGKSQKQKFELAYRARL